MTLKSQTESKNLTVKVKQEKKAGKTIILIDLLHKKRGQGSKYSFACQKG